MKIISYNLNGIRAAFTKDFISWLSQESPDVICLQEIKAQPEQIDTQAFEEIGYKSYWHSAQKKGYSGVGVASKKEPNHVEYGCGIEYIDFEGRIIRADFDEVSVLSVYVPSATNISRLDLKMQFCHDLLHYIQELKKTTPNLVICGDFNICHEAIDIHDPVKLSKVSGFLPMEREWMSKFLQEVGLIDSFRHFEQAPEQYSWWSYRSAARERNKGWRLDYNFVSNSLKKNISKATILNKIVHSDHCPVLVELEF